MIRTQSLAPPLVLTLLALLASGCSGPGRPQASAPIPEFPCDPDSGGIELPPGFCATVFAEELGNARHMAVSTTGDLYVARGMVRSRGEDGSVVLENPGGVVALRDSNGDGKADLAQELGTDAGSGIAFHDGYLYYSSDTEIWRVALAPGELMPSAEPESLVTGFPTQGQHATKPIDLDDSGHMFVTVGAPSNACQEQPRTPGSPGLDPCPQRDLQAAIWRYDMAVGGQVHGADGVRYGAGIRNGFALAWNRDVGALYTVQHGRDSLAGLFPDLFTPEQSADLPAEEMFRVNEGDDFGWPYCYWDQVQQKKVLAPEYGGDAHEAGRCSEFQGPIVAFPAHWAPNDLIFYRDGTFPARYDGGAFIAFHGSWNRMPLTQEGYRVVFVPFRDGLPSGDPEDFATGFPQAAEVRSSRDAVYRPTGLAQGTDGSLFIADSRTGRIWRVRATSAE